MDKVTIDGWVARDEDGELFLYNHKPIKGTGWWKFNFVRSQTINPESYTLDTQLLKNIKWEDDEPTPVIITIQIKKK